VGVLRCSAVVDHTVLQAAQCHKVSPSIFPPQVHCAKVVGATWSEGFSSRHEQTVPVRMMRLSIACVYRQESNMVDLSFSLFTNLLLTEGSGGHTLVADFPMPVHILPLMLLHSTFYFCVSRRRRKMLCGNARLCVCLCVCLSVCVSVRGRTPTLLHGPGCNLGGMVEAAP